MGGTVDQEAFEQVICENLSPEGVATIIAFLKPAIMAKATTEGAKRGPREVECFANTLIDLLRDTEYNRLLHESGL